MSRVARALLLAIAGALMNAISVALSVANGGDVIYQLLSLLAITPYAVVGFLIAWRRPEIPIGWLVLVLPLAFGGSIMFGQYALLPGAPLASLAQWLAFWFWVPGWLGLGLVFLLFPDGRLPSSRWRPVARIVVVATGLAVLTAAFSNDPRGTPTGEPNPLALDAPFSLYDVGIALLNVVFILPAASLFVRYRRANGTVRRQLKWLAYGSAILVLLAFVYLAVLRSEAAVNVRDAADILFLVAIAAPAVAIGIAILRDRVFDIDVLINRTLVYAGVSALLGGAYVAGVVLFQAVLRPLTGGSELAVAASTLLVVALFQPIRRRVQDLVDRRFYRARYDAARTLDAFSSRLRNEVELDAVRADLLGAVGETVRPAHASVWLRQAR